MSTSATQGGHNKLTNKRTYTGQSIYSNNMLLQLAINYDSNLAALLTAVTLDKSKFKILLTLSDSIYVVGPK